MFVRPEHRGAHVGSAMLDRLLELSRDELRAPPVRLDSNRFMREAHRLHPRQGRTAAPWLGGRSVLMVGGTECPWRPTWLSPIRPPSFHPSSRSSSTPPTPATPNDSWPRSPTTPS
ncbi:hypothetical protein ACFS27_23825 [Promicromonospora vindobonensis]|uniref:Acetyltransferase (GNAT) family protein n=1 Tax=Promicromonospora vindobonensis TaxID=195748 RepID=A0ABW5W0C1_9MICO